MIYHNYDLYKNKELNSKFDQILERFNNANLILSERDKLASSCVHKSPRNWFQDTLVKESDGSYVCLICGAKFHKVDLDHLDSLKFNSSEYLYDILNTIKIEVMNIDYDYYKKYFIITSILENYPELVSG